MTRSNVFILYFALLLGFLFIKKELSLLQSILQNYGKWLWWEIGVGEEVDRG
jgi:hypothetical protein